MKRVILFLFVICCLSTQLSAQWTNTAQSLLGPLSQNVGAITYSSGVVWVGTNTLWSSLDQGNTWISNPLNVNGEIAHIFFLDGNNGLVTTHGGKVYKTSDGGITWSTVLSINSATSAVFLDNSSNILVSQFQPGAVHYSRDGGVTWNTVQNNNWMREIIPYKNGKAYLLSGDWGPQEHIWITNDYGASWSEQAGQVDADSYSFDIGGCNNKNIVVVNEEYSITADYDGRSELFASIDEGLTWVITANYPSKYFTGGISEGPNTIFCQTVSEVNKGLVRSTDQGQSWKNIGGPSSTGDTRLIAAIDNNNIVGVDVQGSIWVTHNSGGDSLSSFPSGPISPIAKKALFGVIQSCKDSVGYNFLSVGCSPYRIDSVRIIADTASVFSLVPPKKFPRTIVSNGNDSVGVLFDPGSRGGTFGAKLDIYGTILSGSGNVIFDTILPLLASSIGSTNTRPSLSFSPFTITSSCEQDESYTLVGVGCSNFIIDSIRIEQDTAGVFLPGWSFTTPANLSDFHTDSVRVIFNPNHRIGSFGAELKISGTIPTGSGNIQFDTIIKLVAGSTAPPMIFYSTTGPIQWNSVTECHTGDTIAAFINKGCDSVKIDSVRLINGLTLTGKATGLPALIAPNAPYKIPIEFIPNGILPDSMFMWVFFSSVSGRDSILLPVHAQGASAAPVLTALTNINFGPVQSCITADTIIILKNTGCDSLNITSLSNLTKSYSFDSIPKLPISLGVGDSIMLHATYIPKTSSDTESIFVKSEHGGKTASTKIKLAGRINANASLMSTSPISMAINTLARCGGLDTTIILSDTGCDTITVTEAQIQPVSNIHLQGLTFPFRIFPHSDTTIRISYAPDSKDATNSTLVVHYTLPGDGTIVVNIPIQASAEEPIELLSIPQLPLKIDSLSICQNDSVKVWLINRSLCDTLTISAKYITGDKDYSFRSNLDSVRVPPGDSVSILVALDPLDTGSRSANVNLHYIDNTGSLHDSSISLTASVLDGKSALTNSISTIDFGTLTLCSSGDTSFTIHNSGCVTSTIFGFSYDSTIFVIQPDNVFPLSLRPDSSYTWKVTPLLDTTNHPVNLATQLVVKSDASSQFGSVPLSYSLGYPSVLDFRLVPGADSADSAEAGKHIYYDIISPNKLADYDVKSVDFILVCNGDLLTYENSQSLNTVLETTDYANGIAINRFHITGYPIVQDAGNSIDRAYFGTAIAKTTKTSILLDSIFINHNDFNFEKCIASARTDSSASFSLINTCGTSIFQSALSGEPIKISVIQADGKIMLHIKSPVDFSASVTIGNILGSVVCGCNIVVQGGEGDYSIPAADLPSGVFFLTLSSNEILQRKSFVHINGE